LNPSQEPRQCMDATYVQEALVVRRTSSRTA
jgi:hypothetical protein